MPFGAKKVRKVLVVDHDLERRAFVKDMALSALPDSAISEEKALPRNNTDAINLSRADELAQKHYDFVIYNTLSNPPPKLFIEKFKKNFPQSRVLLYTDLSTFSVGDFNEYRHADGMMSIFWPSDSTDDVRISVIKKTIDVSSKVSPSLTWEWVDTSTKVVRKVSLLATAIAGLVGIVVGAFISNYDKLSIWINKTAP